MKKITYVLLTMVILGLLTACAGRQNLPETENAQSTESDKTQDTEINSEMENANSTKSTPYELVELKIDTFQTESIHTLDLVIFDDTICAVAQIIGENNAPYYLLSFDKNGVNTKLVPLEAPKAEGDVCSLKQFTIGQDGNVYALKTNYIDTSSFEAEPAYDERVRLVCWNTNGNILYDVPLEVLDDELYPNVHIRNLTISKDGTIALCCMHINGGHFIIHVDTNGTVKEIFEDELRLYTAIHFWKNNDGSLAAIRSEGKYGKRFRNYYVWYDAATHTLQEEILIPYDIYNTGNPKPGKDTQNIIIVSEKSIYQYDISEEVLELVLDFEMLDTAIGTVLFIVPINETDYICIFENGSLDAIRRIGILRQIAE